MENFTPIVDFLYDWQLLFVFVGIMYFLFGLFKAVTSMSRGASMAQGLINMIAGCVFMVLPQIVGSGFPFLYRFFHVAFGGDPKALDSPAPVETPAEPTPTPDAPADFSWIPTALTITGIAAVASLVVLGVVHYYRKSIAPSVAKKRADAKTIEKLVSEARETLAWVVLDSASYETDLAKQIDYPMMTDVSERVVKTYIRQMREVQSLEAALAAKPLLEDARYFSSMAIDLKVSYEAAVAQAERVRWSGFTIAEKKRLKDARTALSVVQDSSTTPEQRNAQYKRIAKLLDGLITLTEPVKQSLATWVPMLALETGRTAVVTENSTVKVPVAAR